MEVMEGQWVHRHASRTSQYAPTIRSNRTSITYQRMGPSHDHVVIRQHRPTLLFFSTCCTYTRVHCITQRQRSRRPPPSLSCTNSPPCSSPCPPSLRAPHSPLTPPFHLSTYISTYTTPNNYPIQPPARHMINLHIYSANTSHSSPSLSSLDHPRAYRNQCHRTCASMKRC